MAGRRDSETSREAALISDAGITLSLHAANVSLAREFGLSGASCRIDLAILEERSLPSPALALNFPDKMKNNFVLADQRFVMVPASNRCALEYEEPFFVVVTLGSAHLYIIRFVRFVSWDLGGLNRKLKPSPA